MGLKNEKYLYYFSSKFQMNVKMLNKNTSSISANNLVSFSLNEASWLMKIFN